MGEQATLLAERRNSWSDYWATGALHSCLGSFAGNYAGEVLDAWRLALAGLPGGACVLDIATGNGALPALFLAEAPVGRLAAIDAVDLAQIRPDWIQALDADARCRLKFQGGVMAEALPFPDAHFDLVCSQFGIEYTDHARSLAEAARVLKPGGLLALVLHDQSSLICRNAREERSHLAWIAEHEVIGAAVRVCAFMARAATPAGRQALAADPEAGEARRQLNQVMADMTRRARDSRVPDVLTQSQHALFTSIQAAARSGDPQAGLQDLDWLRAQLAQSDLRLAELLGCALDEAGLEAFLAGSGFVEQFWRPLDFPGGERLGWWLQARKPA